MSPFSNQQESPDNQAIRELRDETKDLNKTLKKAIRSTDRFSWAFMILAFVQIAIGLFQYIQDSLNSNPNKWMGLLWVLVLVGVIFGIIKSGFKEDVKSKNKDIK